MKLGTPFMIILIIGFAFTAIALIVGDFRTNYPEAGDVDTSYESRFNFQSQVNGSFLDIGERLQKIGEETNGWKKILGGLIVIPLAAISTILQIMLSIPYLVTIITGVSTDLGVPPEILAIGVTAIIATIIIMLVKFSYKSTTV